MVTMPMELHTELHSIHIAHFCEIQQQHREKEREKNTQHRTYSAVKILYETLFTQCRRFIKILRAHD